jgi:hypothetical protein
MVLKMYFAGQSYRDIGSHPAVRLSLAGVHQSLQRSMPRSSRPVSEAAETIYLERLEGLLKASWPAAVDGNLNAIEKVRRILAAEARFFGIGVDS